MNKTAIRNLAQWARRQLTEEIRCQGCVQPVEQIACSVFIRLVTRRFLEVNGFSPLQSRIGLQSEEVYQRLVRDIAEEDFKEVEIIGWLYQYYLSAKHKEVVDPLRGKTIAKEDIPVATQVFTPQWVVRYILDNSLGRYWLERNPESRLADKLTYLVTPQNGSVAGTEEPIAPEELKVFDPCVGAGHFLSYAFDLLLEIYRERGWSDEDAARSILANNLYGLDIDERVVQLARFAVSAKAAKYAPDLLHGESQLHILAVQDSEQITQPWIREFAGNDEALAGQIRSLCASFENAGEYGSLIFAPKVNMAAIEDRLRECSCVDATARQLEHLVKQSRILAGEYHIVATNPPYMNKYSPQLKQYLNDHFASYKGDLFSVFMFRSFAFCKEKGYCGFMTPMVWMFLKTYAQLREHILREKTLTTLIQFEYSAFEDATVPICAFVLHNGRQPSRSLCFRLSDFPGDMEVQKQKVLEALADRKCGYFYEADQQQFSLIPGSPIAYWLSDRFVATFANKTLDRLAKPRQGLATGCNEQFVRLWFEVSQERIGYGVRCVEEAKQSGKKWFPYNKGGEYRKWYGNDGYVVNWERDGFQIRNFRNEKAQLRSRPQNTKFYFRESVSWSLISSGKISFRYKPPGQIFDVAGMSCFADENLLYLLGLCNSVVVLRILAVLAPTINFQAGDIANIPVVVDSTRLAGVKQLVEENIALSKADWDAFETSWDFQCHPLVPEEKERTRPVTVADCYRRWEAQCEARFHRLKENEEELNRIFIDCYGLGKELSPEVEQKDVTVRRAQLQREIKSLISYAVGCIFGRYSPDVQGLCYAGGRWDASKYTTVTPVKDNIVLLREEECDGDLTTRIVDWVAAVYGSETLEENLRFIADALGTEGTARQVLRQYLFNGFYPDHVKTYRKRPIYWLISSGKKNSFKALIYLHRYQPSLPRKLLTDYVLPQRKQRAGQRSSELALFEAKLRCVADQKVILDPDDGVRANYARLKDLLQEIPL